MWSFERRALRSLPGLFLVGCGFQLQGVHDLPPEMARTRLVAVDTYSEFYRELSRALIRNGVELTEASDASVAVLTIRRDETDQRVLSVSARNIPREFEVYYTVSYDVRFDGSIRSGANDLTETRDYTWDETDVLGKAEEESVIRSALVQSLVRTVLRRLSYTE